MRTLIARALATGACAATALALAAPAQAQPTQAKAGGVIYGCDASPFPGVFGLTATVKTKGRVGRLYTEKIQDDEAYATVERFRKGDRVTVQRSRKTFRMSKKPKHPSTRTIMNYMGGIKSCVSKSRWTSSVTLQTSSKRSYAVRACVDPKGSAKWRCTRWYVDHLED